MSLPLTIREDALQDREILALLERHLALMAAITPPESVHALDPSGLRAADVTAWTAWRGDALLGCGALKELDAYHGEIKSMHTAAACRGQGVGTAILRHLLGEARRRGYRRLSLETGSMREFASARSLYRRHGFSDCGPFADYRLDPNSVFMTRVLTGATAPDRSGGLGRTIARR